jgi:hypothetical protein
LVLNRLASVPDKINKVDLREKYYLKREIKKTLGQQFKRTRSITKPFSDRVINNSNQGSYKPEQIRIFTASAKPTVYNGKYVVGHSRFHKQMNITINLTPEYIEIPELTMIIPYDRVVGVEVIRYMTLAKMKKTPLVKIGFAGILAVLFPPTLFLSLILVYYYLRKKYLLLDLGDMKLIFSLEEIDEGQKVIKKKIGDLRFTLNNYSSKEDDGKFISNVDEIVALEEKSLSQTNKGVQNKRYSRTEIENAYQNMKQMMNDNLLSEEGFSNYIQGLRFIDDLGKMWTIGKESGKWYILDAKTWKISKPPEHFYKLN